MSEESTTEQTPAPTTRPKAQEQENPLINIGLNVLAPVLILQFLSKDPMEADAKAWHIGPYKALFVALAFPIAYGIWHFIKNKSLNIFSAVGLGSVLLTGIISIYLYGATEEIRKSAPLLFGIKEAVQPLILGSLFLLTHRAAKPLFNVFIYNDGVFDVNRIEKKVDENEKRPEYGKLLWNATLMFFGSFCLSAVMNMGLAYFFLGDLNPAAENWKELFNKDVAKITGWGFLVIGLPLLVVGGFIFFYLIKGLKSLTGLDTEEVMLPR